VVWTAVAAVVREGRCRFLGRGDGRGDRDRDPPPAAPDAAFSEPPEDAGASAGADAGEISVPDATIDDDAAAGAAAAAGPEPLRTCLAFVTASPAPPAGAASDDPFIFKKECIYV